MVNLHHLQNGNHDHQSLILLLINVPIINQDHVPRNLIQFHVHNFVYPNQDPIRDLNLLIIIVIIIITIIVGNHIIHDLVLVQDHDQLYHLHIIIINDHNHQQQQIIIEVEEDLDHRPLIDLELEIVYHHHLQNGKQYHQSIILL